MRTYLIEDDPYTPYSDLSIISTATDEASTLTAKLNSASEDLRKSRKENQVTSMLLDDANSKIKYLEDQLQHLLKKNDDIGACHT